MRAVYYSAYKKRPGHTVTGPAPNVPVLSPGGLFIGDQTAALHRYRLARHRIAQDPPHHLAELRPQRVGVVIDAVAFTDGAHLLRHGGIAARRNIREQMMFDLVAEVAAENMKQPPATQVGRPAQLAQIPLPARL